MNMSSDPSIGEETVLNGHKAHKAEMITKVAGKSDRFIVLMKRGNTCGEKESATFGPEPKCSYHTLG